MDDVNSFNFGNMIVRNLYLTGFYFMISMLVSLASCKQNEDKTFQNDSFSATSSIAEPDIVVSEDTDGKVLEKNDIVPDYVIEILTYIRTNNKAPANYIGGRRFYNREKRLPGLDKHNKMIYYKEWDVHEKKAGQNRGPERLVTSDDKAYYTNDHYKTFTLIKEIY